MDKGKFWGASLKFKNYFHIYISFQNHFNFEILGFLTSGSGGCISWLLNYFLNYCFLFDINGLNIRKFQRFGLEKIINISAMLNYDLA